MATNKNICEITVNDGTEQQVVIRRVVTNTKIARYNNKHYRVTEKEGSYQIDPSAPLHSRLQHKYSDYEIMSAAHDILTARFSSARGPFLESPDVVKKLFQTRHSGLKFEHFDVAYLDNRHRLIEVRTMYKGDIAGCSVPPRPILEACLSLNSAAIVCAHNHPSNAVAEPSNSDVSLTKKLSKALDHIGVRLLDHIVTTDGHAVSLAERGDIG